MTVASSSYLVSITRRQQVAQIRSSPVYVVTGVTLIPLSSQKDASNAISQARKSLEPDSDGRTLEAHGDSDSSEDGEQHLASPTEPQAPESSRPTSDPSSVAEDVIGKRGQYGRFAERWFSRKGWSTDKRRTQGMSTENVMQSQAEKASPEINTEAGKGSHVTAGGDETVESSEAPVTQSSRLEKDDTSISTEPQGIANSLLPKLLRTTNLLLASRNFFFSYDYDITRRIGSQETKSKDVPLFRSVDPLVCRLSSCFA